jgi:hypothetical protein
MTEAQPASEKFVIQSIEYALSSQAKTYTYGYSRKQFQVRVKKNYATLLNGADAAICVPLCSSKCAGYMHQSVGLSLIITLEL